MQQTITLRRAYDPESPSDGYRVYIDRLWPRGLSHATFHYDWWDKDISPTADLREWFHADPDNRWQEFCRRYKEQLLSNPSFATLKSTLEGKSRVTLLYSSRDELHNNAVVVKEMLQS